MSDLSPITDLSDDERAALEEIERGLEEVRRAHGALVDFHHAVGRGIDHFDEALAELGDGRRYPIERAERDELEESA
ncbi:hypothetical protein C477_02134 [Haloterrigena salina JCM 13891]|uniref:Uncharacterized protein n=1 Tax=Haloterrigena salina JCM 13891 TaxID=1227488 RepID=M0CKY6_9EURY|nr:hypothetical protein [Haloterrigena salina]ELZ23308.1 hypothetical protein C477_02134 [Haloterrigena salina JCM 13891]